MKIEISKDWCLRMAQREGVVEIGAGRLATQCLMASVFPQRWAKQRVRT